MSENKDAQILQINRVVKTRLAPSGIHGVGVFALRDMDAGEKLYADSVPFVYTLTFTDLRQVRSEIREMLLEQWPQIVNGSKFAYPTTRVQAYMNHSFDANYDAQTDTLLRDVKQGEEILENYGLIPNAEKAMPWLKKKK